jgi:hypothetical protein
MDIYLFGFIIVAFGSLVVTVLVMYSHSHDLRKDLEIADDALDLMHESYKDDLEDFKSIDVIKSKLEASQTARRIQQEEIKELKEELIELEKVLHEKLEKELLLLPR